jgi:hypothetical protein
LGGEVSLAGIDTAKLPALYVEPAVQIAYCDTTLRVVGR